jgi:uncharacterized protein YjeT (DUF2065 family)
MAEQMQAMQSRQLRIGGALLLTAGLAALYLVRRVG